MLVDPVQHHTILALTLANRVMFSHAKNMIINGGEFHVTNDSKTCEEIAKEIAKERAREIARESVQKGKHIFVNF